LALFLEQQRINACNKLVTDERVGFLVPVLPQDVEIYMDRELGGCQLKFIPAKTFLAQMMSVDKKPCRRKGFLPLSVSELVVCKCSVVWR
jgi:hypothetical protein